MYAWNLSLSLSLFPPPFLPPFLPPPSLSPSLIPTHLQYLISSLHIKAPRVSLNEDAITTPTDQPNIRQEHLLCQGNWTDFTSRPLDTQTGEREGGKEGTVCELIGGEVKGYMCTYVHMYITLYMYMYALENNGKLTIFWLGVESKGKKYKSLN